MKKSDNNNFAENIKTLRLSRALSQLEMATRLNVSRTAYAQYEAGTRFPDMETIVQISDIFGVKVDSLFHSSDTDFINDVFLYNAMPEIEHELLALFNSLSDYSKGKLLEKAHILHDDEVELAKVQKNSR